MSQENQRAFFERELINHTDMCYSVAFALTKNIQEARRLTEEVVLSAWQLGSSGTGASSTKMNLLSALRTRFIESRIQPCYSGASSKR